MTDLDRLLIERACERLVQQYCHFVDHDAAARIAELFAEDGVWTSPENTMAGRKELHDGFMRRQRNTRRRSRHVCTNLLVDVVDEDNATGLVYLTLYRHDDPDLAATRPAEVPAVIGEYRDAFVRTSDGWRFKRREVVVSFVRYRRET